MLNDERKTPIHFFFIALTAIFVLLPSCVYAGKPNFLDRSGDYIANKIDTGAEKLDIWASGRKYTRSKNDSNISIKQLIVHREGGVQQDSLSFGFNLRLPNLERRWQLRFSSYDEEEEKRDLRNSRFRTQARQNRPGAAVQFFKKLGKIKTTFQPRLALKDPLEMNYLLRFETESSLKAVSVRPKLELFADAEKGTGQYFQLNFSYNLAKRTELSFLNEEEYRERGNFLNVNHAVAIDYALSENRSTGFSASTNSTNRGGGYHLESYAFSPSYAQILKENRLKYTAATFIAFAKPEAYKGDVGTSLQVELIF